MGSIGRNVVPKVLRTGALLGAAAGFPLFVGALFALVDPVGTQLANDADPLGTPPSRAYSTAMLVVSTVLMALPWLINWVSRRLVPAPSPT